MAAAITTTKYETNGTWRNTVVFRDDKNKTKPSLVTSASTSRSSCLAGFRFAFAAGINNSNSVNILLRYTRYWLQLLPGMSSA